MNAHELHVAYMFVYKMRYGDDYSSYITVETTLPIDNKGMQRQECKTPPQNIQTLTVTIGGKRVWKSAYKRTDPVYC